MSRLLTILLAVSGLALFLIAGRLAAHELALVPGNQARDYFNKGWRVEDWQVKRLHASRQRALDWYEHGKTWGEYGLALMLLDERNDEAGDAAEDAVAVLHEALRRQPVQPHAWLRYAIMLDKTEAPSSAVTTALLASVTTGPYEREILAPRMEMLMQHVRPFPRTESGPLAAQIRYLWSFAPETVIETALRTGTVQAMLTALGDDPSVNETMNNWANK